MYITISLTMVYTWSSGRGGESNQGAGERVTPPPSMTEAGGIESMSSASFLHVPKSLHPSACSATSVKDLQHPLPTSSPHTGGGVESHHKSFSNNSDMKVQKSSTFYMISIIIF